MINLLDSNPINGHSFMNDLKKEFYKREMKQTAVDWLIQILSGPLITIPKDVIEKAKEMEKEQIENIFNDGYVMKDIDGEQYYKETYEQ